MEPILPRLEDHLPDLVDHVRVLAADIETGELQRNDELVQRNRDFYTSGRMAAIESVAPGWQHMAAQADGATLHHVTQVLIALHLLPEYRQAAQRLQTLLEWTVLYHDLGKQVTGGQRDALHAFRSATMAVRSLPRLGFPDRAVDPDALDHWTRRVLDASVAAPDGKGLIQDNRQLPGILEGLEQLFGAGSAVAVIVQGVMLHQSLNVVPEWPNPGSLAEAEIPRCIRPALLPVLEGLMLADSDAWQLFEPVSKARYRDSTLAAFVAVRRAIGG
jgi:hypothetical protein